MKNLRTFIFSAAIAVAFSATGPADAAEAPQPADAPPATAPAATPPVTLKDGSPGLRLNFRGVPLEMVLDYLSDAAGFIIVKDTDVKGKVDVWSNQPLSKDEAVDLLNTVLNQNGYAAIRHERTLRIKTLSDAKKSDIPVKNGNIPATIPKTDEMITQVIPVRHVNASQLIQNLSQLLPDYATLTANDSGNALVLTDTQADVRRMVEIVTALDQSLAGTSTLRVFPLRYADAKDLASAIKDLFAPATTQQGGGNRGGFGGFGGGGFGGFGGGGFGGFGGRGGGAPGAGVGGVGGGGGGNRGNTAGTGGVQTRVVAVADERTNSLIVSAPDDAMPDIEDLVKKIDVSASDITELRVFHLRNSDPVEMASLFADLFPDDTKNTDQNQNGFRFNGGGFRGFPGITAPTANTSATGATSDRMKKKGRVMAVPDPRTSSIIVSAASELMPQIAMMVEQLDASPAKRQKVFVYSLENADVQQAQQILSGLFQRTTTTTQNRNANQNSILTTRENANQQTTPSSGTTFGTSSSAGGTGGGGSGLR